MKSTTLLSKRALVGSTLAAAGLALASSTFTAAPAQAFGLSINPQYGTTNGIGTGATATLDFSFVDTIQGVLLNLGIKNTTNGSVGLGATQATLVGVALDMIGGVQSFDYDSGSSAFIREFYNTSIPGLNGNKSFDFGIRSAGTGNFVGGNPTAGLTAGQSTNVSFLLGGTTGNAAQVESSFFQGFKDGTLKAAARFQQVNGPGMIDASDKVMAGEAVPEPTTMGGLLLGGGILAKKWRSRKQQQKA